MTRDRDIRETRDFRIEIRHFEPTVRTVETLRRIYIKEDGEVRVHEKQDLYGPAFGANGEIYSRYMPELKLGACGSIAITTVCLGIRAQISVNEGTLDPIDAFWRTTFHSNFFIPWSDWLKGEHAGFDAPGVEPGKLLDLLLRNESVVPEAHLSKR